MAESRVLPLSIPVARLAMLFFAFMILPFSACTSPSVRPEDKPDSEVAGLPACQQYTSPDNKAGSWSDLVVLAGAEPGPLLMVVAGVHGDEASGPLAARRLASAPPPLRGTLVILPVASPEAMAAGQRWLPGWSDLNRAFPDADEYNDSGSTRSTRSAYAATDPTYLRADEILALIVSVYPDLVLDLHESDEYWTEGDGPALVVPASAALTESMESPSSAELALALLELPGMEGFAFTGPPPAGSLVEAVDGLLGVPALLVEMPDSMASDDRISVYLAVVHGAMQVLGMGEGTVPLTGESP
ncbi:MAG: succinylglutamate desuccinylase/aspartoacylase family protein [Spirochaetia bacterium]|nr:succinylglutamate desuccinylase/aspartoacylase family protein [Spirochaetia bacterium]